MVVMLSFRSSVKLNSNGSYLYLEGSSDLGVMFYAKVLEVAGEFTAVYCDAYHSHFSYYADTEPHRLGRL